MKWYKTWIWKYCNDIKEKDKIIVDHKYTEVIAIPNKEWVNEFVSNNDTVDDEGLRNWVNV